VKDTVLIHSLQRIRRDLSIHGLHDRRSNRSWLQQLQRSGVLHPIPLQAPDTGAPLEKLFLIEFGAREDVDVDPIELLQAWEPRGVICYFTALRFHALTTQPPSHHHVAVLVSPVRRPPQLFRSDSSAGHRTFTPLGTPLFWHKGLLYHRTSRDPQYLPGIQTRFLNDRAMFRISTLEQTLLDTLHRPMSCGGPSVVFEAWEEGLPRIDETRLLEYLSRIDNGPLARRVGYMLEARQYEAGKELTDLLERHRKTVVPDDAAAWNSLLPGYTFSRRDERWLLEVP
jgi:hypothetical protein